MDVPQNPAGAFVEEAKYSPARRHELIAILEKAPAALRQAVAGLSETQLDTRYRNWTIRQIVHHFSDSHVNAYTRFKLALTEDQPTIKPYFEDRWVALAAARTGSIQAPLALFEGVHACWVQLLSTMTDEQFARSFFHPETSNTVRLDMALAQYAWHCRHHTAQINWLRKQHGW